jgi:hypothetical protein
LIEGSDDVVVLLMVSGLLGILEEPLVMSALIGVGVSGMDWGESGPAVSWNETWDIASSGIGCWLVQQNIRERERECEEERTAS